MFLHKTPGLFLKLFPDILWHVESKQKEIYLTFDDGPVPEATPWVLETLKQYKAKATFFMVGDNISRYKNIFNEVLKEGHSIGNHTFNHLNGWRSSKEDYVNNVNQNELLFTASKKLFRPPHGRLSWGQYLALKQEYKIIMWDVLSGDFSPSLTTEKCLKQSINRTVSGSIIVFHDSSKAISKLKGVLPHYLAHFTDLGYSFKAL